MSLLFCDSVDNYKIKNITIENTDQYDSQTILNECYTNLEEGELLKIEFQSNLLDNDEFTLLCEQAGFKIYYRHRKGILLPDYTIVKRLVIILKKME